MKALSYEEVSGSGAGEARGTKTRVVRKAGADRTLCDRRWVDRDAV